MRFIFASAFCASQTNFRWRECVRVRVCELGWRANINHINMRFFILLCSSFPSSFLHVAAAGVVVIFIVVVLASFLLLFGLMLFTVATIRNPSVLGQHLCERACMRASVYANHFYTLWLLPHLYVGNVEQNALPPARPPALRWWHIRQDMCVGTISNSRWARVMCIALSKWNDYKKYLPYFRNDVRFAFIFYYVS